MVLVKYVTLIHICPEVNVLKLNNKILLIIVMYIMKIKHVGTSNQLITYLMMNVRLKESKAVHLIQR